MAKTGRPPGPPKKTGWERAMEGMARAATNSGDFRDYILEAAVIYATHHQFFDMDDIKRAFPNIRPHHQNAWGHLTDTWCGQGWCRKTGVITIARSPIAHSHKLCQLESLIYDGKAEQPKGEH